MINLKSETSKYLSLIDAPWDRQVFQKFGSAVTILTDLTAIDTPLPSLLWKFMVETSMFLNTISETPPMWCVLTRTSPPDYVQDALHVVTLPKVDHILGWYRTARAAYIPAAWSEPELLISPLASAAIFGLPVVTEYSDNFTEHCRPFALIVEQDTPEAVAASLAVVLEDRCIGRQMVLAGWRAAGIDIDHIQPFIQVEGPIDSSYSLAIVNREVARKLSALHPEGKISVLPLDIETQPCRADEAFLQQNTDIAEMYDLGQKGLRPLVSARYHYPPHVSNARGVVSILSNYGWEESAYPWEYIEEFNLCLDGISVASNYVARVLKDNGLRIPVRVTHTGADQLRDVSPETLTAHDINGLYLPTPDQTFVFLHISSCFPRKAPDILIEAFCRAFTCSDNVVLIVKTFPNPHNRIEEIVDEAAKRHGQTMPKIVIINQDISPGKLLWLYQNSDCLVLPSRGEGFGIPAAEAMFYRLPVITTAHGGQTDFCTQETAWLIDYNFQYANTHLGLFDSVWAEPDIDHLTSLLKEFPDLPEEELKKRTDRAFELICSRFTWEYCAKQVSKFAQKLIDTPCTDTPCINVGWITTWNIRCGIAEYSRMFLHPLIEEKINDKISITIMAPENDCIEHEDEEYVMRCWKRYHESVADVSEVAISKGLDVVVIQFHFAFFPLPSLERLIKKLRSRGIRIYIFMHAVEDLPNGISLSSIKPGLKAADRIFCHSVNDLNIFKRWGLVDNVTLFPHGVPDFTPDKEPEPDLIAFFGFLMPHKGISQLLNAFKKLIDEGENIRLLLSSSIYPAIGSWDEMHKTAALIEKLGIKHLVEWHREFQPLEKCLSMLSRAKLIVLPYQYSGESSSAAVRTALASHRPVLCTPLSIFDDVRDVVHYTHGTDSAGIASGLQPLLNNPAALSSKQKVQERWLEAHSWRRLNKRFFNIVESEYGHE